MKTTKTTFRNLITNSMNTKQISKIAFAIMILFSMASCKKETPVTVDNIKPKMQLNIQGNGFNKTFYSDSADYFSTGKLYLKPNVTYSYSLTITDTGGVSLLQMQSDTIAFHPLYTFLAAAPIANNSVVSSQLVRKIIGDRSNPYTSFVMTGKFIPNNTQSNDPYILQCFGNDYSINLVGINIQCVINNQPPSGFGWKEF